MYHIQARIKPHSPSSAEFGVFRNITRVATSLEAAKASLVRLKLADPYREYRICSERTHAREEANNDPT